MALYRLLPDSVGVINTTTGAMVPNDAENADWRAYQAWVGAGGTPDPVASEAIGRTRSLAYREVARQADTEFSAFLHELSTTSMSIFAVIRNVDEARRAAADGSPTAANYPFLDALRADGQYASIAAASTGVLAWWDTVKDDLGAIEAQRWKAFVGIAAAATANDVDTAATVTWP